MRHFSLFQNKQCKTLILYCILTCSCAVFSFLQHPCLLDWILYNDWAMFLIWHCEFHIFYLLYHILNRVFLGRLRSLERRNARRKHLDHLANTIIIIFIITGFDLLEVFCWLQWSTPFGFLRMCTCVMTHRLNNPLPLRSKEATICRSNTTLSSTTEESRNAAGTKLTEDPHLKACTPTLHDVPSSRPSESFSPYRAKSLLSRPNFLIFFNSDAGWILLYAVLLLFFLFFWSFLGHLVYGILPLNIKLLLYYEVKRYITPYLIFCVFMLSCLNNHAYNARTLPMKVFCFQSGVCTLKLLVIIVTSIVSGISESSNALFSKFDFLFLMKWNEKMLQECLYATRYGAIWFLLGHSLIFSFADIFIFMKLKSIFSHLVQMIQQLQTFFLIQRLVNDELPTVYLSSTTRKLPFEDHTPQETPSSSLQTRLCDKLIPKDGPSTESRICCYYVNHVFHDWLFSPTVYDKSHCVFRGCGFHGFMTLVHRLLSWIQRIWVALNVVETFRFIYSRVAYWMAQHSVPSQFSRSPSTTKHKLYSQHSESGFPMCVVCRDTISVGKELPCSHLFHRNCLRQWLESDLTCPICRSVWVNPKTAKKLHALHQSARSRPTRDAS